MPLSVFDGEPSIETHEHYDTTGNLTGRTVVTRHSDWDVDGRAWALGLAMREAAECRKCGGDLTETTDFESWRWSPQPPVVCLRCVVLAEAEQQHRGHPQRAGMIHRAKKSPRPKRNKPPRG